jgi:hypothetical protein
MTTFWMCKCAFHHDVKISLVRVEDARPPLFTLATITSKVVVYAPAENAGTLFLLYPCMFSVDKPVCTREVDALSGRQVILER